MAPGAPAPSEEKRIRACSETRRSPARAVRSGRGFGACGPPRKGRTERATRDLAAVPFRYAGDDPRAVQSTMGGPEPAELCGARVLEDRHPDTVEVVVDPVSLTKPEAVFGDVPLSGISRSRRPGAWAQRAHSFSRDTVRGARLANLGLSHLKTYFLLRATRTLRMTDLMALAIIAKALSFPGWPPQVTPIPCPPIPSRAPRAHLGQPRESAPCGRRPHRPVEHAGACALRER